MSTQQTNHIGTILQFEGSAYNQALQNWETVLPEVNKAIQFYLSLNIGDVSNIDIKDFLTGDSTNIERLYRATVEKNLKDLKITAKAVADSFKSNINSDMKQMNFMLSEITKLIQTESRDGYEMRKHFGLIEFKGDKAILPEKAKETIKRTFQIIIETAPG